ncbi:MAG: EpsG family protein [Candidatus Saccharibacteria bacterium]|nr:EpsG family protein [Moraxellaceae bacterium]
MACTALALVADSTMIYYSLFFFAEGVLLLTANLMRRRVLGLVAAAVAIAFCGFRYETGYDYNNYRDFFENIEINGALLEPGFYFLVYLANMVELSTFALFFLFALMTHGLAYLTLSRMSIAPNLAFLIYLLIPGLYLNSFSVIRSAFAVVVFGYAAVRLISGGSRLEFIVWGALAASFHYTATLPFVVAFMIFLAPMGLPRRSVCIFLLITSLFASQLPLAQNILNAFGGTKFDSYAEMKESQNVIKIIASNLLALFVIWRSGFFKDSKSLAYYYKIWLVGVVLFNIFVEFSAVTRVSYYFGFFSIPLMICAVSGYGTLGKLMGRSALIVFFAASFVMALYNDTLVEDPLNMLNYQSIFDSP